LSIDVTVKGIARVSQRRVGHASRDHRRPRTRRPAARRRKRLVHRIPRRRPVAACRDDHPRPGATDHDDRDRGRAAAPRRIGRRHRCPRACRLPRRRVRRRAVLRHHPDSGGRPSRAKCCASPKRRPGLGRVDCPAASGASFARACTRSTRPPRAYRPWSGQSPARRRSTPPSCMCARSSTTCSSRHPAFRKLAYAWLASSRPAPGKQPTIVHRDLPQRKHHRGRRRVAGDSRLGGRPPR